MVCSHLPVDATYHCQRTVFDGQQAVLGTPPFRRLQVILRQGTESFFRFQHKALLQQWVRPVIQNLNAASETSLPKVSLSTSKRAVPED